MSGPMLSNAWYRVADLRPRLRTHARLHRHVYRGEVWYLLQDPVSNRTHRFTPSARLFIAAMDGRRSVSELWRMSQRRLGDDAPTQDEVIQLMGQLHAADLLQSDVMPDTAEVHERGERLARATWVNARLNPMSMRIHLWDPNALLDRWMPWLSRIWSPAGGIVWLLVMGLALLLLPSHWSELSNNFADRVLAIDNLFLLWLVFPVIKLAHEMGHAVATKRGGGEVHDMGVVLLVLIPVPYVEASAASVFKSKYERAMVGAAGMAVELFLAALAFLAWMVVEPGIVRALLFNVMIVAGVSTLVFNGNPLLRYDAYYMLADLIEMPNLAGRSLRYWGDLIERRAFGAKDLPELDVNPSERGWLLFYGAASSIYRVIVTVSIALFIGGQFFFIGVLLAIWAVASMAVWPIVKGLRHIAGSPGLHLHRRRAWGVTAAFAAVLGMLLFAVPAPFRSVAEGVVWLPEQAQVRLGHEGFLTRYVAAPGSPVRAGQVLVEASDPRLTAQIEQAQARVAESEASYGAKLVADRAAAMMALEQLHTDQASLSDLNQRAEGLVVKAASDGVFTVPRAQDLPGRYLKRGDLLGYVMPIDQAAQRAKAVPAQQASRLARVVVTQDAIDLVRHSTSKVLVRYAHQPELVLEGRVIREVPSGAEYLPSRALTTDGGGQLAIDPRDQKGAKTMERTFQFDVAMDSVPAAIASAHYGERVYVRFDHAREPLGWQMWRGVRRLFLSHFQV